MTTLLFMCSLTGFYDLPACNVNTSDGMRGEGKRGVWFLRGTRVLEKKMRYEDEFRGNERQIKELKEVIRCMVGETFSPSPTKNDEFIAISVLHVPPDLMK